MIDNLVVGKTIAALRQSRNMTQQQLAAMLNVSHQAVSKWENGAALPDVQTLMALSQFFGITMEQLLTGEIPPERMENSPSKEEPLRDIGSFFNDIVSGIFSPVQEKGADPDGISESQTLDLEKLLQTAPYMSKTAVDALLLENRAHLTGRDIVRFAPYISRECLEKLIENPAMAINWDILQKIAPFLSRETVDQLAHLAAASQTAENSENPAESAAGENLGRALGDVSQSIGKGVSQMIRHAARLGEEMGKSVNEALNTIVENTRIRSERVNALRRAAFERALQDEKWDWMAEHIDEIDDADLLRDIAQRANALGMYDWVLAHLNGYADTRTTDAALKNGNWEWLGDHLWQFDGALQEKIALAAAHAEKWDWLSANAEQLPLDQCAEPLAMAAYSANARSLTLKLLSNCSDPAQREAIADAIAAKEDYEFLAEAAQYLTPEYFGRLCLARAQAGQWPVACRFAEKADHASIERMAELAIAEGNFEAIDSIMALL